MIFLKQIKKKKANKNKFSSKIELKCRNWLKLLGEKKGKKQK